MAAGIAYKALKSQVGLNVMRPLIAAWYLAIYLLPLTFPATLGLSRKFKVWAAMLAFIGSAIGVLLISDLLQPGPVKAITDLAALVPIARTLLFAVLVFAAVYNLAAVTAGLIARKSEVFSKPEVLLSLLVLVFFVAEQAGIGGNIPFYDRYILQVTPFMGVIGFFLLPNLTRSRVAVLLGLSLTGHALLWRYALR
jgi:hypothetical protein